MVGLFDEALHLAESGMLPRDYVVEEISEEANRMVEGERRVFIVYFLVDPGQVKLGLFTTASLALFLDLLLLLRTTPRLLSPLLCWLLHWGSLRGVFFDSLLGGLRFLSRFFSHVYRPRETLLLPISKFDL